MNIRNKLKRNQKMKANKDYNTKIRKFKNNNKRI